MAIGDPILRGGIVKALLADIDLGEFNVANGLFKIPASIVQGDVFFVDVSGKIVRLAAGTNGYFLKTQGAAANPVWAAGAGGSTTWLALTDTPAAFTGQAGKYSKVNAGETGLEFGTPAGAGDMTKAIYDPNDDGVIAIAQTEADMKKSLFDAFTILYADADNTPLPLTVPASTLVGRKATGGIAALTAAEAKTLLAIAIADISDIPGTIATILTDHDKAAHDALEIDAGSVDGKEPGTTAGKIPYLDASAFLTLAQVVGNVPALDAAGKLILTGTGQIGTKTGDLGELWNKTTKIDHGADLAGLTDDDHTQYLLAAGSRALSADWDAGSHKITAEQLESDIAIGTAPLIVTSTTVVTNLNADKVDGADAGVATGNVFKIPAGIAQGDVFYVDASGNIVRLAAGTSGHFLKTQGAAANPVWAAGGDFMADGSVPMTGDLNLAAYGLKTTNLRFKEYSSNGFQLRNLADTEYRSIWLDNIYTTGGAGISPTVDDSMIGITGGPTYAAKILLYGANYATYGGRTFFTNTNAAKDNTVISGYFQGVTDTPKLVLEHGLLTDLIEEKTADAGVTIDSLLIKDGVAVEPASLTFVIDGGGVAITTGQKGHLEIPYGCTIDRATLLADQSGSIVIDIWKDTYANFPPTDADSITASAPPTISSAQKSQDSTLTAWTKTLTAGDILAFNVDSCTTITRVTLALKVTKN